MPSAAVIGSCLHDHPAHAALVSEADFIKARDTSAPRGPAGPAARRYLLAGLLTCGRCGRRLESAWSHDRAAYRCRRGHTSATVSDPDRPKATYLREDQVLPHLAALAILRAESGTPDGARQAGITAPARIADLIDRMRADGVVLTYDRQDRTLRADGHGTLSIATGMNR